MKKTYLLIALILAAAIVAYILIKPSSDNSLIGGQRDSYGCLTGAGYSYDSEIGLCTRSWEINTPEMKQAAKIIADNTDSDKKYGLTIDKITKLSCDNCFAVKVSNPQYERLLVIIRNNSIESVENLEETQDYVCPENPNNRSYFDCMPKVGPDGKDYPTNSKIPCSGPYYEWIKANCDIEFAY